ncbi:condensation domain-containing protein [Streptomyces akebiae]|uniref:Acyltransferase papA2 n=1 Tax=Streptomyces akebiae TaxID=2865673 RepID=A0ABX8XY82_9ACTN|nr:condensation domain-containing protein [Streptomyces akebiae]QYX80562.1 acyltransferase papA2 [Streptomyces akebiae]
MRMTDIQHCEVRPGLLVEWTLDQEAIETATGLPEDSRPPAYVQESHIRTAKSVREDGLFVPTWLGTTFDIPGMIDLDVLQDALRTWTLRHETLRSGFRWAGDELRRFTLDAEAVVLHREVVGEFSDVERLVQRLQDRFDVAANALSWPNFIYAAIVRDDGTSVYMAFDHSNVDAYSIQQIPAEIHELCATAVEGCPVQWSPVGSYVDFCEIERAEADRIDDTHEIVARWREFIDLCGGDLPNFPIDLGLDPGGPLPAQKLMHDMLVDADDIAAFDEACRPFGGVPAGLLAATSLVVHKIGGEPAFRTVVPFHTRAKSEWRDSVGWYVGGAPIEIHTAQAVDFRCVLDMVHTAVHANRSMARLPIGRVLRLLGSDFRPTSPDLYSIVSFIDTRHIPGSERWTELKAYGLVRVSYGDRVCAWFNRLHEGLYFAARYPDTDIAYKNMRLYVEQMREVIFSVARNGPGEPV